MKLFLSSTSISPVQAPVFIKLVGKPAKDIKIALVENAADAEPGDKPWIEDNRKAMRSCGFQIEFVNLENYKHNKQQELRQRLEKADAIWLGGGNTYYLRWILKRTGADSAIKELIAKGKVYGGGSAGAIMAGPTLKFFETADDPKYAPEYLIDGLGFTSTVVVPHWQSEDNQDVIADIAKSLKAASYAIATLTNAQALVINGERQTIVESY